MSLIIGDVEQEYAKSKLLRKEDVAKLLEWARLQPHLPRMTEMQVIHFLHSNYFRSEDAKKCIDNFFTVRTICPEFFANRNPKNIDFGLLVYTVLPKSTPEGYRIIYGRLLDTNPEHYTFQAQVKLFDMVSMLTLNTVGTSEGQILIHDLLGLTLSHITRMNLMQVKKSFVYLQECIPFRLKGLHFVNTGNVMEKLLMVIKPFMKKELFELLHMHSDLDALSKFIPKECMPNHLDGGTAGTVEELQEKMKQKMFEHSEFFAEEEKQKVDENKRPGKPKDSGQLFGVEGTFRKLELD